MKKTLLILAWFPLALTAQTLTFQSRGVGGGGALFSPSINPANPDEYFIACDMSELFHTTDHGATYTQVGFTEFVGGHNSRVNFTSTPGLLYAISYENEVGTPMVSSNNGTTWTPLSGNPDPSEEVYTLHADYQQPNRMVISHYGEIFFSNNAGSSFTSIHTALDNGAGNVVAGVFFDGNMIYIGTNDGVLVSTNGGTNWNTATITGLPANERIWSFCAAKSGSVTRLFCLTGDVNDIYVGLQGSDYWGFMQGVYRCDYGLTQWVPAMNGISAGVDFCMFVDMAENDTATVYIGGSNDNGEPNVMKSTNAGRNWSHTFLAGNNQNITTGWSGHGGDRGWGYGECLFGMDVSAGNKDQVLIGDFGFPHYTSDGGNNWRQAYVSPADEHPANSPTPPRQYYHSAGIENTTCWQLHWSDANHIWACFSDIRGCRSTDGGETWSFDHTGLNANTTYRVVSRSNGTLIAATSNIHDMYQSTRLGDAILDANDTEGKLIYSTDTGATWQLLHAFNHPVFWIAIDPNQPNRAYASVIHYNGGSGTGGVYRCDDLNNLSSSNWTLLPDPPRTQKHPASLVVLNDGKLVATYSGRRDASGFTASSGVFIYDPVSNSWTDVSDPGMHYWTKDIVIDPTDATQNTWYVGVFSGWGGPPNGLGGLYRTTNRGTSWAKLTGNTLDRVTSITFHPDAPGQVYITTEGQGLWACDDIHGASLSFYPVTAYPFRQPERVFFHPDLSGNTDLWVTSFGNGMKKSDLQTSGITEPETATFLMYPNPSAEGCTIVWPGTKTATLQLSDMQGKVLRITLLQPGSNSLPLHDLPAGVYTLTVNGKTSRLVVE